MHNSTTDEVHLLCEDEMIAADASDYVNMHVIPFAEIAGRFDFGEHEFKRTCSCRPEIQGDGGRRAVVIHQDRKTN